MKGQGLEGSRYFRGSSFDFRRSEHHPEKEDEGKFKFNSTPWLVFDS